MFDKPYLVTQDEELIPDPDNPDTETLKDIWWKHLTAGAIAGAISRTCTAPLDRLKIYMQVHGNKNTGIISSFQTLLEEGGILSFWRGNGINILKIAPEFAIKFGSYEHAKQIIRQRRESNVSQTVMNDFTMLERLLAGSAAGGISQTIIYPLEVIKTRLILRKTDQYGRIIEVAKHMYRKEGLKSFYRGYIPCLLGVLPYAGIDLTVYETLRNHFTMDKPPSGYLMLACGTVSSSFGQFCTYPLALIKTKLQASTDSNLEQKNTMTSVFKNIMKTEGVTGLYRGIVPNYIKVVPAVSISYLLYDKIRIALGVRIS